MADVEIITSAHWDGDARLRRHLEYLERAGHRAAIVSFAQLGRVAAMFRALRRIVSTKASHVILPDPELFFVGSAFGRLTGSKPVIDVHEDYAAVAMVREWVPVPARPLVSLFARLAIALGRLIAWKTMVAAEHLSHRGDVLVENVPDPESLPLSLEPRRPELIYVGDVTIERGAVEMVRCLRGLPRDVTLVVIGRIGEATRAAMEAEASGLAVSDQMVLVGRMGHDEAWSRAAFGLIGLNLLHDTPAYRRAVATKIWEYMSVGLPPVVSNLQGQAELVSRIDPSLACNTTSEVTKLVETLLVDTDKHRELVESGRKIIEEEWAKKRPDLTLQGLIDP